ncbi:hypothetical protein ACFLQI_03555, partial [Candidatus Undinarchaeota archaeon]
MGVRGLFLIAFVLMISSAAFAAQEVEIGTYILNIGEYEIEKGAYKADFYLWFYWDGEIKPDTFEIMNGEVTSKDVIVDEPGWLFYRIHANLHESPDLHNYPKDIQTLAIKIEDSYHSTESMYYVPNHEEIGLGEDLEIRNWNFASVEAEVTDQYYANWDETYSRYTH